MSTQKILILMSSAPCGSFRGTYSVSKPNDTVYGQLQNRVMVLFWNRVSTHIMPSSILPLFKMPTQIHTLLIFQLRKSRFLFVSRRETRILFVLLWKWWKSQCIIWESLSYGGLKNTLMDYAGFMGINNWYIQCGSSQQFSLDSTKKPQMSNRDFSFGLSLKILKKALRKILSTATYAWLHEKKC